MRATVERGGSGLQTSPGGCTYLPLHQKDAGKIGKFICSSIRKNQILQISTRISTGRVSVDPQGNRQNPNPSRPDALSAEHPSQDTHLSLDAQLLRQFLTSPHSRPCEYVADFERIGCNALCRPQWKVSLNRACGQPKPPFTASVPGHAFTRKGGPSTPLRTVVR